MKISVRRVSYGWEHPKDRLGRYISQIDQSFSIEYTDWKEMKDMWEEGYVKHFSDPKNYFSEPTWVPIPEDMEDSTFEEEFGCEPHAEHYRPDWVLELCTCFQLYNEYRSVPISPVFERASDLAVWALGAIPEKELRQLKLPKRHYQLKKGEHWLAVAIEKRAGVGVMYRMFDESQSKDVFN